MLENNPTQQNLQNVPFTPGQPIAVPTSAFGKDVQESIIDNYFNGRGSVYAAAVNEYNNQFTKPQQVQQAAPQQEATPQLSTDEIAALTNIKNMIDANPQILVDYARASMGNNNQPVQQQAQVQTGLNSGQTNNVPKDESSVDMWDKLFGNDNTQQQQVNQPQPGQDVSAAQSGQEQATSFIEATRVACLKKGVDYNRMSEWTGEFLTPENLVDLYTEVMRASQEPQPQQQQQSQQQMPQPLNLSEAPSPNTVKILAGYQPTSTNTNNPFWR